MGMRWRLRRFFYTLLVLVVILLVAFLMLRSRYREIVTELAETQVKNATSDLTNCQADCKRHHSIRPHRLF